MQISFSKIDFVALSFSDSSFIFRQANNFELKSTIQFYI